MAQPENLQRLGELLLEEGIVTSEELTKVLEETGKKGSVLGELLLSAGHVKKEELVKFLAQNFQVPQARLGDLRISPDALKLVPFDIAAKHEMIPLERIGNFLCVAKANFYNRAAVIELRRITNLKVKVIQADAVEVQKAIQFYYKGVGEPPSPSQAAMQAKGPAALRESTAVRPKPTSAPAAGAGTFVSAVIGPIPANALYALWVPREDAMSIARVWKEDVAADWERTYASDQPLLAGKITR